MNMSIIQGSVRRVTRVTRASGHKSLCTAPHLPIRADTRRSQIPLLPRPTPLSQNPPPMPKSGSSSQRNSPRQHRAHHQPNHRSDNSGNANRRLGKTAQHLMAQGPPHDQDDGPGPSHTKEESDPNRKPDGSRFEDYAFFWKVSQRYGWASQWHWEPFDGPARLEGGPPLRPVRNTRSAARLSLGFYNRSV